MFGVLGLLGSAASALGGLVPSIAAYLTARSNSEATEFAAMTSAEQGEYVAAAQATSALNAAKATHGRTRAAQFMVYLFGVPPAIHWTGVYLTATFPSLGLHVDPLHSYYATAELEIARSFFLLAPAMPLVGSLASRLRA